MQEHPVSRRSMVVQNRVLACMDPGAFDRLRSHLGAVVLQRRDVLQEHNRPIDYVYFIERGVASLFARTRRDGPVEVAMVGRLGFVGVAVVLGTMRSPNRALMGVPGEALRIASHELRRAMDDCPGIRNRLLTYVHALLIQNTQTALCNARHEIEERLCRWLLLASDRLDEHVIPLTHEMLSMILGVRRAGVTETLSHLERVGAVKKARGAIEIVDRAILEQRTCECYRIITSEYRHLINSGQHEHIIELGSRALDRVKR